MDFDVARAARVQAADVGARLCCHAADVPKTVHPSRPVEVVPEAVRQSRGLAGRPPELLWQRAHLVQEQVP